MEMEREELIEHQKAVAKRTYDCLPEHAELLGGAPRDWYFGNSAKDLDFFIRDNYLLQADVKDWTDYLRACLGPAFTFTEVKSKKDLPENYAVPHLEHVITGYWEDDPYQTQIQFIIHNNTHVQDIKKTFDFSINKIGWDSDVQESYYGDDFDKGMKENKIFWSNEVKQDRYDKLKFKYPNMKLTSVLEAIVIPPAPPVLGRPFINFDAAQPEPRGVLPVNPNMWKADNFFAQAQRVDNDFVDALRFNVAEQWANVVVEQVGGFEDEPF